MPDAARLRISATLPTSPTSLVCLTSAHYFRQRQIVFIVELGIFIEAEVRQAFAFFVSPSAWLVS
jgi:hypothetical protein